LDGRPDWTRLPSTILPTRPPEFPAVSEHELPCSQLNKCPGVFQPGTLFQVAAQGTIVNKVAAKYAAAFPDVAGWEEGVEKV
jgi:hypothetical protein